VKDKKQEHFIRVGSLKLSEQQEWVRLA